MREVSKYTLHKDDKQQNEEMRRILESIETLAKMSAETTKAVMALANKEPEKLDIKSITDSIVKASKVEIPALDLSKLSKPLADAIKSKDDQIKTVLDAQAKAINSINRQPEKQERKPTAYKFIIHRNSVNLMTSVEAIPQ